MRATRDWHRSRWGRVALVLGSVQLAVPVMVFVSAALAWGTYLESRAGVGPARADVYGSWWFIGLMGLVCVSLVFAVVTRYPWKQRHAGFMTVHAGLLMLIAGGFWSLFGRSEGRLVLEEGMSSEWMEGDAAAVEVREVREGKVEVLGAGRAREGAVVRVGGVEARVLERWASSRDEWVVADDGHEERRGVEIAFAGEASGEWVTEERAEAENRVLSGLRVRVLGSGAGWQPAPAAAADTGFVFVVEKAEHRLGAVGSEVFAGWKVLSVDRFERGVVADGKVVEGKRGEPNPVTVVTICDDAGTVERHTCFERTPAMVMTKTLQGTGRSGARLVFHATSKEESLTVFGAAGALRFGYCGTDGVAREIVPKGLPAELEIGGRKVRVLREATHARLVRCCVRSADGEKRPAIVVQVEGASAPVAVGWRSDAEVALAGRALVVHYGPEAVRMPFEMGLVQFRKMDYPGTGMAMAYESEVRVGRVGGKKAQTVIRMNEPYTQGAWKVYQSGYLGKTVSIFNVMKDPGLPLTYAGAGGVCLGILVTFFGGRWSSGHPGVA